MPADYEAVQAGAKEAVAEWLATSSGRETVTTAVKFAVLDWLELSATGQAQIPLATENAVTAWLRENQSVIVQAVSEGAARRRA